MTLLKERYELHEKLGEGGMAEVYRASQINLDREVAVKFIKATLTDDQFSARFQREAKAIAQVSHPNILQVYDFDRAEDGRYFMVTELLRGSDLSEQLSRKKFSLLESLNIVKRVAEGLAYAHQHKIIHRDIKPSNIFLTDDGRVIITDFGVAKMLSAGNLTETGMTIGTPHYFAPEQGTGDAVDHRVDIYALGVVFYELLTGETPYKGDTTMSIIAQHINAPIPDPRAMRDDLPPQITAIINKAMAKKPQDRYADAREFLAELEALAKRLPDNQSTLVVDSHPDDDPATVVEKRPSTQATALSAASGRKFFLIAGIVGIIAILLGAAAFLLMGNDKDKTSDDTSNISSGIAPAAESEILVIVANVVGDDSADVDVSRYISDAMQTGDIAIVLGDQFRLESTSQEIDSAEAAEALAAQTNAQIVIWGVLDGAALQVTLQAHGYAERTFRTASFSVPRSADFGAILVDDVPRAVSYYTQTLLMQRILTEQKAVVLLQMMSITTTTLQDGNLRITPSSALDGYALDAGISFSQQDYVKSDAAVTQEIMLLPDDPALYYWRYMLNGMFLDRIERAQGDGVKLYELLPDSEVPFFGDMFISFLHNDYDMVLKMTDGYEVKNTEISYAIMSYRIIALCAVGQFETALQESEAGFATMDTSTTIGNVILSQIQPLQIFLYEINGDSEKADALKAKLSTGALRGSDLTANFYSTMQLSSLPPSILLLGGYISELDGNPAFANFAYQTGVQNDRLNFLLNWRQGHLKEKDGDYQAAYDHYQTALDNTPVPFPVAAYDQAQLVHAHADELDQPADACELLSSAEDAANTSAEFYAKLLESISAAQSEFGCG